MAKLTLPTESNPEPLSLPPPALVALPALLPVIPIIVPSTDCAWGEWGAWSDCDPSVGDTQIRSRTVDTPAAFGGAECTGDSEEEQLCPAVDCAWGQWGEWECCEPFGEPQVRRRIVEIPAAFGGAECTGDSEEERPCPVVGEGEACCVNANCAKGLLCDSCQNICRTTCYPTMAIPTGPGSSSKWSFCTNWCCQEGEGDCDSDNECEGDLVCAHEMCPNTMDTSNNDVDCCGQGPTSVAVSQADLIEVFFDSHPR